MTIAQDHAAQDFIPISEHFRKAMRELASGVSIITAGRDNEWAGMTATSVTSLSLEPPAILVCINRSASIVPFLERYWHFAVSFLSTEQRSLANRFAGRGGFQGIERFRSGNWSTLVSGSPVLGDALAILDCKLEELIPRHSHLIVIGRVLGAEVRGQSKPLIHWHSDYVAPPAASV